MLGAALVLGAGMASALEPAAFESASVKLAALTPDVLRKALVDAARARRPLVLGMSVGAGQARFICMSLEELITIAYGARRFEISGPAWMKETRYDILAKLPSGAPQTAIPAMLKALLKERFKLVVHRGELKSKVLALEVGKGGAHVEEALSCSPGDLSGPLKPGESELTANDDGAGPARVLQRAGGLTMDLGADGKVDIRRETATRLARIESKSLTMAGLARALASYLTLALRVPVVDRTGLAGCYHAAVEFSPRGAQEKAFDTAAKKRREAVDAQFKQDVEVWVATLPKGSTGSGIRGPDTGSTPLPVDTLSIQAQIMTRSMNHSLEELGLTLNRRSLMIERLIVDHAEQKPVPARD
jgi:uncharacterized protein (TIGR03435 family)